MCIGFHAFVVWGFCTEVAAAAELCAPHMDLLHSSTSDQIPSFDAGCFTLMLMFRQASSKYYHRTPADMVM